MLAELQPSVALDHLGISRASLNTVCLEPERTCQSSWDPEDGIDISSTSTLGDFAQHGTSTAVKAALSREFLCSKSTMPFIRQPPR